MITAPSLDDIFAAMSAAAVGDTTARVALPCAPAGEHVPTRLALALNVLLDDLSSRMSALERTKRRFARLADSGLIGIIVTRLDGRVVEINDTLLEIIGHSRSAILSGAVPWSELTPPEWRDVDARAIEQLRSDGVAGLREKEYTRKDGSRIPVLAGSATLDDTSGDCISFVLDLRENRLAKAAVERLRESRASEAMFRGLVEAVPDAVIIVDPDNRIAHVNSHTERLFGFPREELLQRSAEILTPERFREAFRHRLAGYLAGSAAVGPQRREGYGLRKDGTEFPYEATVGLLQTAGRTLICSSVRDTTERRKSEQVRLRLASLVEASDDAIVGKTFDGQITSWNGGAQRLFGYSADEMIGNSIMTLVPQDRRAEEAKVLEHLARGQVERFETVRLHKDGHEIHVAVTTSPVRDSEGKLIGAAKVVHDITQRHRAQVALARAKDAAEAANRELEAFSYSVAHDLRAPLRGMNGCAHVLLEDYRDKLDAQGQDWLQEIIVNASKMGELIDGLLALSRLSRSELRPQEVDLSSVACSVVQRLSAGEPERAVETHLQEGLTAVVDPRLARALLENLLGNAWKFTSKTGGARVAFGATEEEGERTFFVRDNGAGFDMAFAGKLFAPFQRLHTADEFPGTGVGLATVQRIVHRHGGRIRAEGVQGAGATFYFTLPATVPGGAT